MSTLLFALAILSLILIPLAPKLVRLRIRFLRWIHWNWAVNLLERHFQGWVLFFRIILFVIAAMLFYAGWVSGLRSSIGVVGVRYMQLSPAAIEDAIRLLDGARSDHVGGEIAETADRRSTSALETTR